MKIYDRTKIELQVINYGIDKAAINETSNLSL